MARDCTTRHSGACRAHRPAATISAKDGSTVEALAQAVVTGLTPALLSD